MIRISLSALLVAILSACGQQNSTTEDLVAEAAGAGGPTQASEELVEDDPSELPSEFARTAWRAIAENGARYTTYLDEGGRYRDYRNGDPWQTGSWETDSEDRLCFLPDPEGGVLRCWHPDRMQSDDRMIASNADDKRIRLERADYSPPADAGAAAENDAEADTNAG